MQHINYYRGEQCCKDHKDVEKLFQVTTLKQYITVVKQVYQ